jgi:hypothetical protein
MARAGGENGNAGRESARGGRYFPFEYTALALLEHMIKEEGSGPFTSYSLRKVRSIRGQRRDRFVRALRLLVEMGWIEVQPGKGARYRVTDVGRKEYLSWGLKTLEFVRSTRIRQEPGERTSSFCDGRSGNVVSVSGIALRNFG